MRSSASKIKRRTRRLGKAVAAGIATGGAALAAFGAKAVQMAADAAEAANKFRVVMGDSADKVRERFQQLTDTIPLTISQMQKLSSGVQDLLVPMGVARSEAAGMSADFVELAADLASFNNVPTPQALEAIKSGLAGMSRPLRQFGVDVRKTRLQQIALTEGLIEQGEELNRTARAQAVMVAVQQDSTDAMGDAARTAGEFKNQTRFLRRDLRSLSEDIGDALIPAVRDFIQQIRNNMPQVKQTIATVMADSLVAVREVLKFFDGAVKEIGIGGLIGFVFFGPAGAAVGGIIGKLIAQGEAKLKRLANNISGVDIEISGAARTQLQLEETRARLENIGDLRENIQGGGLVAARTQRLRALGIDPAQDQDTILTRLEEEAGRTKDEIEDLEQAVQNLLQAGFDVPRQAGLLGEVAQGLDPAIQNLRAVARGESAGGAGGGGFQHSIPGVDVSGARTPAEAARRAGGVESVVGPKIIDPDELQSSLKNVGEEGANLGQVFQNKLLPSFDNLINKAFGADSALGKVASSIVSVVQGFAQGGPIGGGLGLLTSFAGFFQHGGTIPAGQFGIVGESGPEPVAGPATVFPSEGALAASADGGGGVSLDPRNLSGGTRFMLAKDPAWQAAVDEFLDENERRGGKTAEFKS